MPSRRNRNQAMSNKPSSNPDPVQPMLYQIRVEGHLGRQWRDWFGDLAILQEESGDTLLSGPVVDQAALHGLLKKVRDLGLPLVSVVRLESAPASAPAPAPAPAPGVERKEGKE
jgi:hypothetical protein